MASSMSNTVPRQLPSQTQRLPAIARSSGRVTPGGADGGAAAAAGATLSREVFAAHQAVGEETAPVNYERVLRVLTHKHTCDNVPRHLHALAKIVRRNPDGLPMRDAALLNPILSHLDGLLAGSSGSEYMALAADLCGLLALPLQREQASAASSERRHIVELLGRFAAFLRHGNQPLSLAASAAILQFARGSPPSSSPDQESERRRCYNEGVLAESGIGKTVAEALGRAPPGSDLEMSLLLTLRELTNIPATNAAVAEAQMAETLCALVGSAQASARQRVNGVEVLWNMLESDEVGAAFAAELAASDGALAYLKRAVVALAAEAKTQSNKQLRNELVVCISLLARQAGAAARVAGALLEELVQIATATDLGSRHPTFKALAFNHCYEDFELHKLLVSTVVRFAADGGPLAAEIVDKSRFWALLFQYIQPKSETARAWTEPQFEELQLQALASISQLYEHAPGGFERLHGTSRLLTFLEQSLDGGSGGAGNRSVRGTGNGFFSTGDFSATVPASLPGENPNARAGGGELGSSRGASGLGASGSVARRVHAMLCLRVLVAIVSPAGEARLAIRQELADQGLIGHLLGLLDRPIHSDAGDVELRLRTEALLLISAVCEGNARAMSLFSWGVKTVIGYLQLDPKTLAHENLLLAALDCLRCCVAGCGMNEGVFLESEGVFVLLDLLENGPERLRNVTCGTLVDICENKSAMGHVRQWRSDVQPSVHVGRLLVRLWREEEARLNVSLAEDFILADCAAPLQPLDRQPDMAVEGRGGAAESEASEVVGEIASNLRAKIFALLSKLGFEEAFADFDPLERVTLVGIRHYLSLKRGEVWLELAAELAREGIEPTETDRECLELAVRANQEVVDRVRELQADIVLGTQEDTLMEEQEEYSMIQTRHLSELRTRRDLENSLRMTAQRQDVVSAAELSVQ